MTKNETVTGRDALDVEIETRDLSGKYLTFFLGKEEYGIEILKVREIIGLLPITSVPRTPEYMCGVINLRGKVIPVVDLRLKFGMPRLEKTEETCIIVVQAGDTEMGTIVDKVSEVAHIASQDIEDAPSFGTDVNTDYIMGIGKSADRVRLLLDIEGALTKRDVVMLNASSENRKTQAA